MTINIIGKKEKKLKVFKVNCYPFGDLAMKRKRNMLLLLHGIPSIKISLLFPLVAMTFPSKKQVKFLSGP